MASDPTPTAVTNNVRITVHTQYSADHSAPPYRYFFAYRVVIANEGDHPVQLLSRRWVIKDANGRVQVVEGPGVVGEQPRIQPGQSYEYTSGCPLPTAYGEMKGWYRMVDDDGDSFNAIIPTFKMLVVHDATVN